MNPTPNIALQDLPLLRQQTDRVSSLLRQHLIGHLQTLRPIYSPERILGRLAGGKVEVLSDEKVMKDIKDKYTPFKREPYHLALDFDPAWLTLVGNAMELYPWEYRHTVDGRAITMTSPVRWVMNYKTNCTLADVRCYLEDTSRNRPDDLRQFVVNALVLQAVLNAFPGLLQLFADLRYEVKIETPPEFHGLPLVTATSNLGSFRPEDALIAQATAFSGVPAFIELVDSRSFAAASDPLRERVEAALK